MLRGNHIMTCKPAPFADELSDFQGDSAISKYYIPKSTAYVYIS